ncbi:MAG: hypothetical protein AAFX99_26750, partial [Myxococcota bacterium]
QAAFPEASVEPLFEGRIQDAMLSQDGHYRREEGFWWASDTTYHYHDGSVFFRLREETSLRGGRQTYSFDRYALLLTATEDLFGNRTEATPDYQVLASSRVEDANGNVSEVLYDPLGVAVATSFQGNQLGRDGGVYPVGDKVLDTYAPVEGATAADVLTDPRRLLQGASQALFYDLEAFERGEGPPHSIHIAREQHCDDGEGNVVEDGPIQVAIHYVDGFGRAIQTKTKADPGPAVQRSNGVVVVDSEGQPILADSAERWLTSGHDVYNNKGLVVRTYEPFFSTVPRFESDAALRAYGVATHMRYDPMGRLVRQDLPDGTFSTQTYGSWTSMAADANDNVIGSDYETQWQSLPTSDRRRQALDKARAHANTPTITENDPLGRPCRVREVGDNATERVSTVVYGPLGQPERVIDPRNLTAFRYVYDMLGRTLLEHSMDAGTNCVLLDVQGQPIHQWDGRGIHTRVQYDRQGRHTETRVMEGAVDVDGTAIVDRIVERVTYGDNPEVPQAQQRNVRGQVLRRWDDAGVVHMERYHADGQAIDVRRTLRTQYKDTVDWTTPAAVPVAEFEHRAEATVDALGRVTAQRLPDGTTREYTYAQLGHVSEVRLTTADGALERTVIASNMQTNARGQQTQLELGNGVRTSYTYDAATFRLQRLRTQRVGGDRRAYLDIAYTYDPVGNITHWVDRVQDPGAPAPLIAGITVSSACTFTYDPFYQLKEATGRVHQALMQQDSTSGRGGVNPIKGTRHLSLDNGAAIERYTRTYDYDPAGNLVRMHHWGASRNWTTEMWTSATSNRSLPLKDLNGVEIADPEARFDASGHMVRLPHVRSMDWNVAGRLSRAVLIDRSGSGQPDDAEYYVYSADGIRVRRITERLVGGQLEVTETTYFEGCEIRRITRAGNIRLL